MENSLEEKLDDLETLLLQLRYPYILAWGRLCGSNPDYVADQVAKAADSGADYDSIYLHTDVPIGYKGEHLEFNDIRGQVFQTYNNIGSVHTKKRVRLEAIYITKLISAKIDLVVQSIKEHQDDENC